LGRKALRATAGGSAPKPTARTSPGAHASPGEAGGGTCMPGYILFYLALLWRQPRGGLTFAMEGGVKTRVHPLSFSSTDQLTSLKRPPLKSFLVDQVSSRADQKNQFNCGVVYRMKLEQHRCRFSISLSKFPKK